MCPLPRFESKTNHGDTAMVTLRRRGQAVLTPLPKAQIPGLKLAFYDDFPSRNPPATRPTGKQLIPLLENAKYDDIQKVLDDASWSIRDDLSKELLEAASGLTEKALDNERGRRLLDRLYDELMSGSAWPDELSLADSVLALKARRIAPEAFV